MILLIDVGNTAVKWAVVVNDHLQDMVRFTYSTENFERECLLNFTQHSIEDVQTILVSNVAGCDLQKQLVRLCNTYFQVIPHFAEVTESAYGLVNAYSPPQALGVDRWLGLGGANHRYEKPYCVVDCGTAVTIDCVDAKGIYIGGVILPGLETMRQSLAVQTDGIQKTETDSIASVFANNTKQCVLAGTVFAISSLTEKLISKMTMKTNKEVTCILTGGDAQEVGRQLSIPVEYTPELVLQGLHLWGKENVLV